MKRRLDQIVQAFIGGAFGMMFAFIPLAVFLTLMPSDVDANTKTWLIVYAGSIGGFVFGRFMKEKPSSEGA